MPEIKTNLNILKIKDIKMGMYHSKGSNEMCYFNFNFFY